jgi:hypothetical protein
MPGSSLVFGPMGRTTQGLPSRTRGCASCQGGSHAGASRGGPLNNGAPGRNDGDARVHAAELHVVGAALQSEMNR